VLLDQLSKLSLEKLWDLITDYDWDPQQMDMNRLIMEAVRIALGTQTKVDDTMLKKRQTDMMPLLLQKIAEARATRPPLLDLQPNLA
jgi:hypothetical protein